MSHASAVSPLFPARPLDLAPFRQALRQAARVLSIMVQVAGFASVLWLAAAGPGFLSQHDSTVSARRTR